MIPNLVKAVRYQNDISTRMVLYGPAIMVQIDRHLYTPQDVNEMWRELGRTLIPMQLKQRLAGGVEITHFFRDYR